MSKRRKLESAVERIHLRYGKAALKKGISQPPLPQPISTSFKRLNQITGCNGIPQGHITLLSGPPESGKRILAYKSLSNAQRRWNNVCIIQLNQISDADYLERCGVKVGSTHLFFVQPTLAQLVPLLLDLVQTKQLRMILVDSLLEVATHRKIASRLQAALDRLVHAAREANCAVVFIDETKSSRDKRSALGKAVCNKAALCLELQLLQWMREGREVTGYQSLVHVTRSRWPHQPNRTVTIEIVFNGTVKARDM